MEELCFTVDGRYCHLFGAGGAELCILCGVDSYDREEIKNTAEQFFRSEALKRCCLAHFETENWNADFSPWPCPPVFGKEPFTGKAADTLKWLSGAFLPRLEREGILRPDSKKYIAGYSLSGLFALWAFLTSDFLDGAASCSGSLWFPGWMAYLKSQKPHRDGIVYLSLGDKEEHTKNPTMVAVGDNTRESYDLLKHDSYIQTVTLEWNKGGHFANPTERLVRGMLWLAENGSGRQLGGNQNEN